MPKINSSLKIPKAVDKAVSGVTGFISPNTVDDFKAAIGVRGGLAKADRFAVFFIPPRFSMTGLSPTSLVSSALSGNLSLASILPDPRVISILCESCTLPGRVLNTIEAPDGGYGTNRKYASGFVNDEVSMTFHITNDFWIRQVFQQWYDVIINQKTNQIRMFPNEYSVDIFIQHMNEKNIPTHGLKMEKAFPINIQAMNVDNNSSDTTLKLTVTFACKNFYYQGAEGFFG